MNLDKPLGVRQFEALVQHGLDKTSFEDKRKMLNILGIQVMLSKEEIVVRGVVKATIPR